MKSSKIFKKYYLYSLNDPKDNKIRYIGFTCNIKRRIRDHLNNSKLIKNNHKNNWIKSLKRINLIPSINIINVFDNINDAKVEEIKLIKDYNDLGYNLTNSTIGGEGKEYFTSEILNKISQAGKKNKGRKHSKETRKKISLAGKGRKHSDETKMLMSKISKINNDKRFNTRFKNGTLKITKDGANEIRKLYSLGNCKQRELAARYNVITSIISSIVNNRIYYDPNYIYIKPKTKRDPFTDEHKQNIRLSKLGKPGNKRDKSANLKANNTKAKNNLFRNKLTLDQCNIIIKLYNDDKLSYYRLAKMFNVPRNTIKKVINGSYAILKFKNL